MCSISLGNESTCEQKALYLILEETANTLISQGKLSLAIKELSIERVARFLQLIATFPTMELVPSQTIDSFIHSIEKTIQHLEQVQQLGLGFNHTAQIVRNASRQAELYTNTKVRYFQTFGCQMTEEHEVCGGCTLSKA